MSHVMNEVPYLVKELVVHKGDGGDETEVNLHLGLEGQRSSSSRLFRLRRSSGLGLLTHRFHRLGQLSGQRLQCTSRSIKRKIQWL